MYWSLASSSKSKRRHLRAWIACLSMSCLLFCLYAYSFYLRNKLKHKKELLNRGLLRREPIKPSPKKPLLRRNQNDDNQNSPKRTSSHGDRNLVVPKWMHLLCVMLPVCDIAWCIQYLVPSHRWPHSLSKIVRVMSIIVGCIYDVLLPLIIGWIYLSITDRINHFQRIRYISHYSRLDPARTDLMRHSDLTLFDQLRQQRSNNNNKPSSSSAAAAAGFGSLATDSQSSVNSINSSYHIIDDDPTSTTRTRNRILSEGNGMPNNNNVDSTDSSTWMVVDEQHVNHAKQIQLIDIMLSHQRDKHLKLVTAWIAVAWLIVPLEIAFFSSDASKSRSSDGLGQWFRKSKDDKHFSDYLVRVSYESYSIVYMFAQLAFMILLIRHSLRCNSLLKHSLRASQKHRKTRERKKMGKKGQFLNSSLSSVHSGYQNNGQLSGTPAQISSSLPVIHNSLDSRTSVISSWSGSNSAQTSAGRYSVFSGVTAMTAATGSVAVGALYDFCQMTLDGKASLKRQQRRIKEEIKSIKCISLNFSLWVGLSVLFYVIVLLIAAVWKPSMITKGTITNTDSLTWIYFHNLFIHCLIQYSLLYFIVISTEMVRSSNVHSSLGSSSSSVSSITPVGLISGSRSSRFLGWANPSVLWDEWDGSIVFRPLVIIAELLCLRTKRYIRCLNKTCKYSRSHRRNHHNHHSYSHSYNCCCCLMWMNRRSLQIDQANSAAAAAAATQESDKHSKVSSKGSSMVKSSVGARSSLIGKSALTGSTRTMDGVKQSIDQMPSAMISRQSPSQSISQNLGDQRDMTEGSLTSRSLSSEQTVLGLLIEESMDLTAGRIRPSSLSSTKRLSHETDGLSVEPATLSEVLTHEHLSFDQLSQPSRVSTDESGDESDRRYPSTDEDDSYFGDGADVMASELLAYVISDMNE